MKRRQSINISKEIDEFKEALDDYKKTIIRAKSHQKLSNYHKKYLEYIDDTVIKSHEKQCNKISNIIMPSLHTWDHFKIYPFLYKNRSKSLNITMPTTLYINKSLQFLIESDGKLKFSSEKNIFSQFLKNLPVISNMPICLFKPNGSKIILFYSIINIKAFINENHKAYGFYQYFILPNSPCASLLMVHAKKSNLNKYYVLQNSFEIPKVEKVNLLREKPVISNENSEKVISMHVQQTILHLKEPEKLIKRQLTFDFPDTSEKSITTEEDEKNYQKNTKKNFTNLIQRIKAIDCRENFSSSNSFISDEQSDKFLVNIRNTKGLTPYKINIAIPEIEIMTNSLFSLIY